MDLGAYNGLFTNTPNGAVNGIVQGVNNGNSNGIFNENIVDNGILRNNLVVNLDAGNRRSYVGGGLNWNDLTLNAVNGTLLNQTSMYYTSINGGAIVFDATNPTNFIQCPINANLNFCETNNDLPFSANIWCHIFTLGDTFMLHNKGDNGNASLESYAASVNTSGRFSLTLYDTNGGVQSIATTVATVPTRRWVNLCHTYSGSGGNAGIKLYINGVAQAVTLSSQGAYVRMRVQSSNLWLGSFGSTGSFNLRRSNGMYSIFQFYNKELTPTEIQQNYISQKQRFNL
jgi:hypothetical protein